MKHCRSQFEFSFFQPRRLVWEDAPDENPGVQLARYEKNKDEHERNNAKPFNFTLADLKDLRSRMEASPLKDKPHWEKIDKRLKTLEFYRIELEKATDVIQKAAQEELLGMTDFPADVLEDIAPERLMDGRKAATDAVDKFLATIDDFEGSDDTNQRFANKTYQAVRGFLVGAYVTGDAEYKAAKTEIERRFKGDRDDGYISHKTGFIFDWEDLGGLKLYKDDGGTLNAANDSWLYSENSGLKSIGIVLLGHAHERYLATLLLSAEKFFSAQTTDGKGTQFYDAYKAYMMAYLLDKKAELSELSAVDTQRAYESGENWAWKAGKRAGQYGGIAAGVAAGAGAKAGVVGGPLGVLSGAVGGTAVGGVAGGVVGAAESLISDDSSVFDVYKANFEAQEAIINGIATPQEWYESLVKAAGHVEEEEVVPIPAVAEGTESAEVEDVNAELMKNPVYKEYFETVLGPYVTFMPTLGTTIPAQSSSGEAGLAYTVFAKMNALVKKVLDLGDIKARDFLGKFQKCVTASEIRDAAFEIRFQGTKLLESFQSTLKQRFEVVKLRILANNSLNVKYDPELGWIDFVLKADLSKTNFFETSQLPNLWIFVGAFLGLQKIETELGITPAGTPVGGAAAEGTPTAAPAAGAEGAPAATAPAPGAAPASVLGDAPGTTPADAADETPAAGPASEPAPAENPEKLTDEQKNTIREKASDYFELPENGILTFNGDDTFTKEQAEKALRMQDIFDPKYNPFVFMVSPGKKVFTVAHYEGGDGEGGEVAGEYMRRYSENSEDSMKRVPAYIHEGYRFLKSVTDVATSSDEIFADMPTEKGAAAEYVKDKYIKLVGADGKIEDVISQVVFGAMLNYFSTNVLKKEDPVVLHYPLVLSDTVTINYTQDDFSQSDIQKVWNGESLAQSVDAGEVSDTESFETAFGKLSSGTMDKNSEARLQTILKRDFNTVLSAFRTILTTHADSAYAGENAKKAYEELIAKTGKFQKNVLQFLDTSYVDKTGNRSKLQSFTPVAGKTEEIQFDRSPKVINSWAAMLDATKEDSDTHNYPELFESLEAAAETKDDVEE